MLRSEIVELLPQKPKIADVEDEAIAALALATSSGGTV